MFLAADSTRSFTNKPIPQAALPRKRVPVHWSYHSKKVYSQWGGKMLRTNVYMYMYFRVQVDTVFFIGMSINFIAL